MPMSKEELLKAILEEPEKWLNDRVWDIYHSGVELDADFFLQVFNSIKGNKELCERLYPGLGNYQSEEFVDNLLDFEFVNDEFFLNLYDVNPEATSGLVCCRNIKNVTYNNKEFLYKLLKKLPDDNIDIIIANLMHDYYFDVDSLLDFVKHKPKYFPYFLECASGGGEDEQMVTNEENRDFCIRALRMNPEMWKESWAECDFLWPERVDWDDIGSYIDELREEREEVLTLAEQGKLKLKDVREELRDKEVVLSIIQHGGEWDVEDICDDLKKDREFMLGLPGITEEQLPSVETPKTELEQLRDNVESKESKLEELKKLMAEMEANMAKVKTLIAELEAEKEETRTGPDAH